MLIVSKGGNLHEMSNLIFLKKVRNYICQIFPKNVYSGPAEP